MPSCQTQAVRSNSIKKKKGKKELGISTSAGCQRPEVEGQQPVTTTSNERHHESTSQTLIQQFNKLLIKAHNGV